MSNSNSALFLTLYVSYFPIDLMKGKNNAYSCCRAHFLEIFWSNSSLLKLLNISTECIFRYAFQSLILLLNLTPYILIKWKWIFNLLVSQMIFWNILFRNVFIENTGTKSKVYLLYFRSYFGYFAYVHLCLK